MLKRTFLVALAMILSASLWASVRTDSMALEPWMLDDYDNVLTYPQMIRDYGSAVRYSFIERYDGASLESLAEGWGVATLGREEGTSLGIVVREPMAFLGGDWGTAIGDGIVNVATIAPAGLQTPRTPENKARLIVVRDTRGYDLGISLGYGVRLEDSTLQDDPTGLSVRWNRALLATIGLGGKLNDLPLLGGVDWALTYYYPYVYTLAKDLSYGGGGEKVFSRYEEGLSTRKLSLDLDLLSLKEDYLGEADLRLAVGFRKHGLKYGESRAIAGLNTDYEVASSQISLGASLGHDVSDDTLIVVGLQGLRGSRSYEVVQGTSGGAAVDKGEESEATLCLPVSLAMETLLKDWLTLRMGLSSDLYKSRSWDVKDGLGLDNQAGSGAEMAEESATLATGFGLAIGNLAVDAQIDQVIYFHGPAFRSAPGLEDSERRPVAQLEASYTF